MSVLSFANRERYICFGPKPSASEESVGAGESESDPQWPEFATLQVFISLSNRY